jgi:plasmid stabilization system protein ParE
VSLEVYFRPEAESDLSDAAEWYESQQSGLGKHFLDEVLRACRHISENPEMYPILHRRTRRAIIHKFPFGLFYRVEKTGVVVFGVLHASRDPKTWKERT